MHGPAVGCGGHGEPVFFVLAFVFFVLAFICFVIVFVFFVLAFVFFVRPLNFRRTLLLI